jgi:hypothetical protein
MRRAVSWPRAGLRVVALPHSIRLLRSKDENKKRIAESKNQLESAIYSIRSKLSLSGTRGACLRVYLPACVLALRSVDRLR